MYIIMADTEARGHLAGDGRAGVLDSGLSDSTAHVLSVTPHCRWRVRRTGCKWKRRDMRLRRSREGPGGAWLATRALPCFPGWAVGDKGRAVGSRARRGKAQQKATVNGVPLLPWLGGTVQQTSMCWRVAGPCSGCPCTFTMTQACRLLPHNLGRGHRSFASLLSFSLSRSVLSDL